MPSLEVTLGWGRWLWYRERSNNGRNCPKCVGLAPIGAHRVWGHGQGDRSPSKSHTITNVLWANADLRPPREISQSNRTAEANTCPENAETGENPEEQQSPAWM